MKTLSLICAALIAAATMNGAAEARELRFGTAASEKTPWGKATGTFQQKLAEKSNGTLTLNVFYSGSLGDEQEMTRQMVKGRLDGAMVSASPIALALPEFNLTSQPFIYASTEQRHCVEDEYFSDIFDARLRRAGLVPLSWVELGNNILFSQKELRVPEDMKGLKLRTPATKSAVTFMEKTGAAAVPSGVSDIMPNLKTGAVNAADTVAIFGVAIGVPDLAPYVLKTNHVSSSGALAVSARTWQSLSEEEQGWLKDAAMESFPGLREQVAATEAGLLSKAEASGATVHELTEEEQALWTAVADAQREEAVADAGPEATQVWTELTHARNACLSK